MQGAAWHGRGPDNVIPSARQLLGVSSQAGQYPQTQMQLIADKLPAMLEEALIHLHRGLRHSPAEAVPGLPCLACDWLADELSEPSACRLEVARMWQRGPLMACSCATGHQARHVCLTQCCSGDTCHGSRTSLFDTVLHE